MKSAKATLTILVSIPRHTTPGPRYISAASKGMTLAIKGPQKLRETLGLTHASDPHCTGANHVTICTFRLQLSTGSYTANIALFDQPPVQKHIPTTAKLLSIADDVPFTVKSGKVNRVKLRALAGVVASLAISGVPSGTVGTAFASPQSFTVTAKDADGDVIVGSYDHPVTLSDSDTTGATTIATSGSDHPPKGELLSSSDIAALTYSGLAIAPATLTASASGATNGTAAFGPVSYLYIANGADSTVTVYALPSTRAPISTISNSVNFPNGLAFDASGNLYVVNAGSNTVTEYAPPYSGAPIATISNGVDLPTGLAFDASDNLYVTNENGNNVTEYAPPYTGAPTTTISSGVDDPFSVAFDASGNLYVANIKNNNVTEYTPPYTSAPTATISNSVSEPDGLAFDASANLYVANYGNSTVTEYAPPYTGAPTATISNSVSEPEGLAFDAGGNLYVGNTGNNTVTEYAPPYTGAPTATISNSVHYPSALAFGP